MRADLAPVAYFSMEVALDPAMPTYSGGLGVLAGDTLRAAADLRVPMLGVSLLHRRGYFHQRLGEGGEQSEAPVEWVPESCLERLRVHVSVHIDGRPVRLSVWRFVISGVSDHQVPVYLLDADLEENVPEDRALTGELYGGDLRHRLRQEAVLGLGGIAVLRALGHDRVQAYHMNEGHSALLTLALLAEETGARGLAAVVSDDLEAVRQRCVFTTHTPVSAGHDRFPMDVVRRTLGDAYANVLESADCCVDGNLNMTHLALSLARYVNGVAMRHQKVSRGMFPKYPINSITNGVHAGTWAAPPFQALFDDHIPGWRGDNLNLRYAVDIPLQDIRDAHDQAKAALLDEVATRTGVRLDPEVLTIGFARRATAYKRADLFVSDMERLKQLVRSVGPVQILYAGKAHPHDEGGKAVIRRVFEASAALAGVLPVVYLEEYDIELGRHLCAGVDLWLNTPQKPQEASGTSGMKAALNGVPSLSVLDGWWVEGHVEGVTGWSIGEEGEVETERRRETESLYDKLERVIVPMFYGQPDAFTRVRRSAISLNGSFFNAQRMVMQYVENAYKSKPKP
jgi:starch phosphorylase